MYVYQCKNCGVVTVEINRKNYSMPRKEYNKRFNAYKKRIKHKVNSCNYCINNWGIDLCACGSGKKYTRCKEGFSVCGKPMQSIEKGYIKVLGGYFGNQ